MALGESQIRSLSGEVAEMVEAKALVLDDCWNTFQYVVNHLSEWADETTIGNELRSDLSKLVDDIKRINDGLKNLYDRTHEFMDIQKNLNRG